MTTQRSRRFWTLVLIQGFLVLVLLLSAGIMSVLTNRLEHNRDVLLSYLREVSYASTDLLNLQSSLRGFIASEQELFLEGYRQSLPQLDERLSLIAGEPALPNELRRNAHQLRTDIAQWQINYAEKEIALMQSGDVAAAQTLLEESSSIFDALSMRTEDLRTEVRTYFERINNQLSFYNTIILVMVITLAVLLLVSTVILMRFWRRQGSLWRELQVATDDLQERNLALQTSAQAQDKVNQQLRARIDESRLINSINELMVTGTPSTPLYSIIAQRIGEMLNGWCSIVLEPPGPPSERLELVALYHPDTSRMGLIAAWLQNQEIHKTEGLHAPLFTEKQPSIVMLNVPQEIRSPADLEPELQPLADVINLSSYIAVPISIEDRPIGVITIASSQLDYTFDAEQELFLEQIADRISSWIEREHLLELNRQRATELQTSFNSIPDIIITFDANGQRTRINQSGQRFFGSELLNGPTANLWRKPNGQFLTPDEDPVTAALRGNAASDVELALLSQDGDLIIHTVSTAALRDSERGVIGAVVVARDITVRKELDRLKEEFLANMSHELRTPLTAILGYSELLLKRRTEVLTKWHVNKIEGIRTGGQRLLGLVNDLLDVAKLDAGQVDLQRRDVDIHTLIQSQYNLLQPNLHQKNLRLQRHLAPEVPLIAIDSDRINQVLTNLLSNAIKFTPESGTITVSTALLHVNADSSISWQSKPLPDPLPEVEPGEYIVVTVSDTGVGIPQESMPHLWDRFYQVEGGASRRFGGTGLGLSIVQQLIELHGGRVFAHSQGSNQGSTFGFLLPVITTNTQENLPYLHHAPTILVIEDDQDTARIFEHHLYDAGYNVIHARKGHEALEWAERIIPAAITLDLILPDSDGWGILAALRQMPHLADVPVVIATVNDQTSITPGLGVSTYLVKPVTGERLINVITNLIGNTQTQAGHILIVDDDADMVHLLQSALQEHGFQTRTAVDGSIAIDMLQQSELPKLMLLDLMMPIVDGFQLLARIRDDPRTRAIPVIIVTARDLTSEEVHQLRYAAQGIQTKHHLDMETLVAEVQRHVPTKEDAPDAGADDLAR